MGSDGFIAAGSGYRKGAIGEGLALAQMQHGITKMPL